VAAKESDQTAADAAIRSVTSAISTLDTDLVAYRKLAAATSDYTTRRC
jgi:hypothetical protein